MKISRLLIPYILTSLSIQASARDILKPMIDRFMEIMYLFFKKILAIIGLLFPSLDNSILKFLSSDLLYPLSEWFPFIRMFYPLLYLALFFTVIAIIAKLWSMSKRYAINSISGIILLIILIHGFGVEIEVTIPKIIISAIFGIPGVIFILILHYLEISI
ncbi:MAG: hypothetical protein DRO94_03075 [Candidatus Altiarchaeales archaeon]|nr:MAG: hypothetical protein DRO95_03365 [Candidatus Altiarchaeales archaeon]RLI94361.1 MAG: hypothetical protein DRO94_03075 [Candidatus Altiarchaeales archaeon]HDO82001.1 hypothetical protein [Candidatus Altiarchaeales archaeon]HEX54650.1 hypothetical protein [Candidatus Altiarchaeales archaeon]